MQTTLNPCFKITVLDFPIMLIEVAENSEIDKAQTLLMNAELKQKADGGNYCVLLDATNDFTVTQESMELIASKEFSPQRLAAAFVVTSLANKLMADFFIKIKKPHTPVRLFTSKDEALKWLKSFIQ